MKNEFKLITPSDKGKKKSERLILGTNISSDSELAIEFKKFVEANNVSPSEAVKQMVTHCLGLKR